MSESRGSYSYSLTFSMVLKRFAGFPIPTLLLHCKIEGLIRPSASHYPAKDLNLVQIYLYPFTALLPVLESSKDCTDEPNQCKAVSDTNGATAQNPLLRLT